MKFNVIDGRDDAQVQAMIDDIETTQGFAVMQLGTLLLLAMHYLHPIDKNIARIVSRLMFPHKGVIAFSISGLYEDTREIFEVPEVQNMAVALGKQFPLLIANRKLSEDSRRWMLCAEAIAAGGKVHIHRGMQNKKAAQFAPNLSILPDLVIEVHLPVHARSELLQAEKMLRMPGMSPTEQN